MSLISRLFGRTERRELPEENTAPASERNSGVLTWQGLLDIIGSERVTVEKAMEIPAFSASVDFIAQTVAELPIELYREVPGKKKAERITNDPRLFALNDEAELLMTAQDAKRAFVSDMLIYGAGYMYISRDAQTLHYVDNRCVSVLKSSDPIFKDADIRVNERNFFPWDFVILARHSRDGVTGTGAVREHELVLAAAYNMMKYETVSSRTGGNKKGFIQSEKQLTRPAMDELRASWNDFYANSDNQMMILNNNMKYVPSASTAMEMQLNQNKLTNAAQIAQIFGLSPDLISGKASNDGYISSIKTAVLPIVSAFQQALNRSLLTEEEKHCAQPLYFAADTTALLRADVLSRYRAYELGLRNGFMQIDEVRYAEDMEPLNFEYIKLGLQDVLLDPKSGSIYTPNTNQLTKMPQKSLTDTADSDIIEERFNPNHDDRGRFASGGGGTSRIPKDSSGRSYKYPQLTLPPREYGHVMHEIDDAYHIRYANKKVGVLQSIEYNATYFFEVHGYNEYNIFRKESG